MNLRKKKTESSVDNPKVDSSEEDLSDSDESGIESDDELRELAAKAGHFFQRQLGSQSSHHQPHEPKQAEQNESEHFNAVNEDNNRKAAVTSRRSLDESEDNDQYSTDDDSSSGMESKTKDTRKKTLTRKTNKTSSMELASRLNAKMATDVYVNVKAFKKPQLRNHAIDNLMMNPGKNQEILKKSIIKPGFEKQQQLPTKESLRQGKKRRQAERANSKGRGWFGMEAQEMTEEKKNDLMVLQMRRALDPKHFYKAPDLKVLPKFFQMGKVVETAADFYHSRIPKKQRKATLVDELLADAQFRNYNKRKYVEIVESKRARGAYRHMKRLKKNKR